MCCLYYSYGQNRHIIGGPQQNTIIKRQLPKAKKSTPKTNKPFSKNSNTIEKLAASITKNSKTEDEKSTAIFNWISKNIAYDHELMFDKTLQNSIYSSEENVVNHVLKRRKALCGGYAFLYRELCASIGIESKVIHGYTKTAGLQRKNDQVHHTWNAVKLNNQWQLLDITWAKSFSTNNVPNRSWYKTRPKDFVKTHLPEEQQWTLLNYRISLREFDLASEK